MKKLNKNFKRSELNIKLRHAYFIKQYINNYVKDEEIRGIMMKHCDRLINKYWRNNYNGVKGYSVIERDASYKRKVK